MGPRAPFAEYVRRKMLHLCCLVVAECLAFAVIFAFSSTNPMYLMEQNRILPVHSSFRIVVGLAAIVGLVGMLVLTRGLLEFIAASDEFIELERLATLGKFSAWASHQIRNPLAVIRGQAQLLSLKSQDESVQRGCALIIKQSDKTSDLLSLMMALSQPVLLHKETINVCDIIADILPLYVSSYPKIVFSLRSLGVGLISGHPGLLEEALKNVITNAVESIDGEGKVEVVCSENGSTVAVEVYDSGPGISDEALESAFEIGFTTKKMGNGLGLAIVKAILNAHKGSAMIKRIRTPDSVYGTVVTLLLPKVGP